MRQIKLIPFLFLIIGIIPTLAQGDVCPALIDAVLRDLVENCDTTERNQACYGHVSIEAHPQAQVEDFQFSAVSDIERVSDIAALRLNALDEIHDIWGVALMRLQASLPDTLPGQNVTFVLFGDTEIVNGVTGEVSDYPPMGAFYLRTGLSDPACNNVPESGLLVRTEQGVGEIQFAMNGVDIAMGSTLYFQSEPSGLLTVEVYTGSAAIKSPFGTFPMVAGTQLAFPVDHESRVSGPPIAALAPHHNQARDFIAKVYPGVNVPPALTQSQVDIVRSMIGAGQALCGTHDFLLPCDSLIQSAGGTYCPMAASGELNCEAAPAPDWDAYGVADYSTVTVWGTVATDVAGSDTDDSDVVTSATQDDEGDCDPDVEACIYTTIDEVIPDYPDNSVDESGGGTLPTTPPTPTVSNTQATTTPEPEPAEPELPDVGIPQGEAVEPPDIGGEVDVPVIPTSDAAPQTAMPTQAEGDINGNVDTPEPAEVPQETPDQEVTLEGDGDTPTPIETAIPDDEQEDTPVIELATEVDEEVPVDVEDEEENPPDQPEQDHDEGEAEQPDQGEDDADPVEPPGQEDDDAPGNEEPEVLPEQGEDDDGQAEDGQDGQEEEAADPVEAPAQEDGDDNDDEQGDDEQDDDRGDEIN